MNLESLQKIAASLIGQIRQEAFEDELQKLSEDTKLKSGIFGGERGKAIRKAISEGEGGGKILVSDQYSRQTGGEMAVGAKRGFRAAFLPSAAAGTGIGAIIGSLKGTGARGIIARGLIGAAIGAPVGGLVGGGLGTEVGQEIGMARGQKQFLAEKGINYKGNWFPRKFTISEEARKKYLPAKKS